MTKTEAEAKQRDLFKIFDGIIAVLERLSLNYGGQKLNEVTYSLRLDDQRILKNNGWHTITLFSQFPDEPTPKASGFIRFECLMESELYTTSWFIMDFCYVPGRFQDSQVSNFPKIEGLLGVMATRKPFNNTANDDTYHLARIHDVALNKVYCTRHEIA